MIALLLFSSSATAHEMTPSYPVFSQSYMSGIYSTTLELFNRRDDVRYYEISVFNSDWEAVSFATASAIIEVDYLQRVTFDVHIRRRDVEVVEYICTSSKLFKNNREESLVSSRICSKVRKAE